MGRWLTVASVVVLAVVVLTGCKYGAQAFTCANSTECGPTGTCQANNLCSFPDISCPSGQRYGDLDGTSAGQCVGAQPGMDAGAEAVPPDGPACFGTGLVKVCLAVTPTMPLPISDLTVIDTGDTTASSKCVATVSGGDGYCVVAATSMTVNATLRAKGAKPLVLVASDSITVNQLIDVGSHRTTPEFIGAGADPVGVCAAGTPAGTRAGGAGGSFTGKGGNGGNAPGGGNGGQSVNGNATVTTLRGGCSGQDGNSTGKGTGGHGGGAVYLIAGNRIDITGPGITASGEGGAPGDGVTNVSSGAGGGGSGGMIGFDAQIITCSSLILANGGGGGEGSGVSTLGAAGSDPSTKAAATGGAGNSQIGGDGGDGSAGGANGPGANGKNGSNMAGNDGGGGGGGGAAGLIKGPAGSLGNNVSPDATP